MITQEQRALRQKYIGSSESAAILGVDPYMSAADVWLIKTGAADGFAGNAATERGSILEGAILDWAEKKLAMPLKRNVMVIASDELRAANLDALIETANPQIVEAKSTVSRDEWGDDGSDEIPERVMVQIHHQMAVMGPLARIAWVPVLMAGFASLDFRMYRIERNDELADMIANADVDFMRNFVIPRKAPDDYHPSLEVLKRVRRVPQKTVAISDELVLAWRGAADAASAADKAKKKAEADLLAAIGDAEAATCGVGLVTYMEQKRKGYTVEPTSYRVLRLKNSPEGR